MKDFFDYCKNNKKTFTAILASALGFFVDLYDIIIFSAERVDSFISLKIPQSAWPSETARILNAQMAGMLLGGFLWGIVGDKFGRRKVLFGSIAMYSFFTLLNAFVSNENQYMFCRFLAGIGLAGELGAGITLVSEQMDKKFRGLAVSLVGGVGMLGAVTAGIVANFFSWQISYLIGAVLGFLLLFFRFSVLESILFQTLPVPSSKRGNFIIILKDKNLLKKFICVLLVGMPGWLNTGVLITFTPEIAGSMEMNPAPVAATVISINFFAFAFGDPLCGLLSQYLQSRKKAISAFLLLHGLGLILFFTLARKSIYIYYSVFVILGISVGYTIMLFMLAAEQFGTNIRTLVTSASLNLTRAWVIPLTLIFNWLTLQLNHQSHYAVLMMSAVALSLALWALSRLDETFHVDMNYSNI
ncbi:MAG: MFS transporter [Chitinophagaceae bacterium]|nr:MFS transporter [Chitinophagaceae bacterium]